eukprot:181793-Rhodomonas_salina.2
MLGPRSSGRNLTRLCDWTPSHNCKSLLRRGIINPCGCHIRCALSDAHMYCVATSEAKGDSADKLFDSVADLFATGLQQELNRAQTKGVTWDWYKQPFVFAMGSPMPGGLHDTATDIVNGIIT